MRSVALVISVAALSFGCAIPKDGCDPRSARGLGASISCDLSGGYDDFILALEREYERTAKAYRLSKLELRAIQLRAKVAAKESQAYRSLLKERRAELVEMQSTLSQLRASTEQRRARKRVLAREIEILDQRLADREAGRLDEGEIIALQEDIARRKAALEAMMRPLQVE